MKVTIEFEVSWVEGKFASRDEIEQALVAEVETVTLSGLGADGASEYMVESATPLTIVSVKPRKGARS